MSDMQCSVLVNARIADPAAPGIVNGGVLVESGRIVASGGPELALQLEAEGYDKYAMEAA